MSRAAECPPLPSAFANPEKRCNIPGCDGQARNLRVHATREHLPWWFNPSVACFTCKTAEKDLTSLRHFHSTCGPDPEDSEYLGLGQLAPATAWRDLITWAHRFDRLVSLVKDYLEVASDDDLVNCVMREGWVGGSIDGPPFEPVTRSALRVHADLYGGMPVDMVRARPANSPKVLALWRVMLLALSVMTPTQRAHIRSLE